MKKNTPIIILVILLAVSSLLFWKGEFVMEKASQSYSIFYFENTDDSAPKTTEEIKSVLAFSIQNNQQEKVSYEIAYLIDNQEISREIIEVNKNEIKTITPSKEIINEIEKVNNTSFEYQIKTEDESTDYKLTKKISFE